jgi:hypothetical protein
MVVKERIDIEELLRWAYQRQKVDRVSQSQVRGPRRQPVAAGAGLMQLGTRIDNANPASMFAPKMPEDAEIIHSHVLALQDLFIDIDGGVWSRDRLMAIGAGLVRDKGGRFWMEIDGSRSPLDCAHLGALVIIHAKSGSQPEWCEGWKPGGARDAAPADRADCDDRYRRRKGRREFTAEDVAFYRAEYECWHAALALLAVQLEGVLKEFDPVSPAAAVHPWRDEKKAA